MPHTSTSFQTAVDPASPYTLAAYVRRVLTGSALIVVLPSSLVSVGEIVEVVNTSSVAINVTFRRAGSDTINGATADVVCSVAANSSCGAARRAAADWRSVQPSTASLSAIMPSPDSGTDQDGGVGTLIAVPRGGATPTLA